MRTRGASSTRSLFGNRSFFRISRSSSTGFLFSPRILSSPNDAFVAKLRSFGRVFPRRLRISPVLTRVIASWSTANVDTLPQEVFEQKHLFFRRRRVFARALHRPTKFQTAQLQRTKLCYRKFVLHAAKWKKEERHKCFSGAAERKHGNPIPRIPRRGPEKGGTRLFGPRGMRKLSSFFLK